MQRILVTGSKGQLGNELEILLNYFPEYEYLFTDIEELNITSQKEVNDYITTHKPNILINCAGYTAVDKAEDEPEKAHLINSLAVGYLAQTCKENNCFLIHISTDYVFDGKSNIPYSETDIINPTSVYGKTKAEGEIKAIESKVNGIIIRTSWLYSSFGSNFVKTIIRLSEERDEIKVIYDQIGSPTYARDLALMILLNITKFKVIKGVEIFHYSNEGVASWFEFAKNICNFTNSSCKITPIETKDFIVKAKRPGYSLLNKTKIKLFTSSEIPHWQNSLKECLLKF